MPRAPGAGRVAAPGGAGAADAPRPVGSDTKNLTVGGIRSSKIKRFTFHGWDAKLKFQTEIGTFKVHRFLILQNFV